MKVKELMEIMGENQCPIYVIHWGAKDEIEHGVEKSISSDDINTIIDLFGEEDILSQDALYVTKDEKEITKIHIYLNRVTFKNKSGRVKGEKEENDFNNSF